MEVFNFSFKLNPAVVVFQQIFAGIAHKTVDTVIQNLKRTPYRLFKPEKLTLRHKRINVISETRQSLQSRAELGNQDRFLNNISLAQVWLKAADSVLSQLNEFILKVKKIAIQMTDKTSNHEVWKKAAKEVEKLFVKIADKANTQKQGKYIFARNLTTITPLRREKGGGVYQGDVEEMEVEVEPGSKMKINLVDSNFLTKPLKTLGEDFNLDPGIDPNTRLSDLNLGRGVNLGSIKVNNAGMSWDINLNRATTVGDVINTINSSGIPGLSVDINASPKGLKLTYTELNEPNSGQEFTISELNGTTARDLGIWGNLLEESTSQPGSLEGQDLNPILTEKTPISLLKGGKGMVLGTIKIALGGTQVMIDLSSASTAGEIIDGINNSIPGVIASVNNSKKGISIESTILEKSLVISEGNDKKSAHCLGISGSPDILGALSFLMGGLNNGDREAIWESLEILNLGLEEILSHRAEIRAKLKRLENIETRLISLQPDTPRLLSEVSGTDVFRATTDLANQQFIFQSALKRGAAVIQPTLLNFIR